MQLINSTAYTVGEEQDIALEPGDLLWRVLETDSGTGHFGSDFCERPGRRDTKASDLTKSDNRMYASRFYRGTQS